MEISRVRSIELDLIELFFVMGIGSRRNPIPITVGYCLMCFFFMFWVDRIRFDYPLCGGLRVDPNAYSWEKSMPSHAQWKFPESAALS